MINNLTVGLRSLQSDRPPSKERLMIQQIKRGDIFYADFDPVQGSEQGGVRPCLVVQNDIGNIHSPTVVVVPLTGSKKAFLPTHVRIIRKGGLRFDSIALCEQLRTIDRTRLDGFIGRIDRDTQATIDAALAVSLELPAIKEKPFDLTLCYRCKSDFEEIGRLVMRRGFQRVKESCDRCQLGMGWHYAIFETREELI